LNAEKIMPVTDGELRTTNDQNWNTLPPSMRPSVTSFTSKKSLQEEIDALLSERLDLHAQLFDAAQIQRKLSGPRVLRHGEMQFASEVFAARFLSGDFITFSQNDSTVFLTHGDIAGKGIAAGMWFTNLAGLLQSYGRPRFRPGKNCIRSEPSPLLSAAHCPVCDRIYRTD